VFRARPPRSANRGFRVVSHRARRDIRRVSRGFQNQAPREPDYRRRQAREPEPGGYLRQRRVPADPGHEPGQLPRRELQNAQLTGRVSRRRRVGGFPRNHFQRNPRRGGAVRRDFRVYFPNLPAVHDLAVDGQVPLRPPRCVGQGVYDDQRRRLESEQVRPCAFPKSDTPPVLPLSW